MRRGDIVTVSRRGESGKPRPAVIVQADVINEGDPPTYLQCPITTDADPAWNARVGGRIRIALPPTPENGLRAVSHVMVDKVAPVTPSRIGGVIGRASEADMQEIGRALVLVLGLAPTATGAA